MHNDIWHVLFYYAVILAVFPIVGIGEYAFLPSTFHCGIAWNSNLYYGSISCLIGLTSPFIITVYCYTRVMRTSLAHGRRIDTPVQISRLSHHGGSASAALRRHRLGVPTVQFYGSSTNVNPRPAHAAALRANAYNPHKAVKHVIGICGVFVCLWVPTFIVHIYVVIKHTAGVNLLYKEHGYWFITVSMCLIYISIAVNPFLYIIFNHRMKRAIKKAYRRLFRKNRKQRRSTVFVTNYSSSSHRAAMRRHRLRYPGACRDTARHQKARRNSIRNMSIDSTSTFNQLDVHRGSGISNVSGPSTRVSHSMSEISCATFPDFFAHQNRSSLNEDGPQALVSHHREGGTFVGKSRNAVQVSADIEVRRRSISNPAQEANDSDSSTGNVTSSDTPNYQDTIAPISILVQPSTVPTKRRIQKYHQRDVFFSDSALTSATRSHSQPSSTSGKRSISPLSRRINTDPSIHVCDLNDADIDYSSSEEDNVFYIKSRRSEVIHVCDSSTRTGKGIPKTTHELRNLMNIRPKKRSPRKNNTKEVSFEEQFTSGLMFHNSKEYKWLDSSRLPFKDVRYSRHQTCPKSWHQSSLNKENTRTYPDHGKTRGHEGKTPSFRCASNTPRTKNATGSTGVGSSSGASLTSSS